MTNSPSEFADAVAKKLHDSKPKKKIKFDVLLVFDFKSADPQEILDGIRNRLDRYQGVEDCIHVKVLDSKPNLLADVFLVDIKHASVSFAFSNGDLDHAVVFRDQYGLAQQLVDLFDNRFAVAEPYKAWAARVNEGLTKP